MKIFSCQSCNNTVYFENRICGRCGHKLGYGPERETLLALESDGSHVRVVDSGVYRCFCTNADRDACNWLIPEGQDGGFCVACRHNGTVPDLSTPGNPLGCRHLEVAKHRLFYSLLRWRLPLRTRSDEPTHGLIFNFLADTLASKVMTGHENGIITIALAEADEIEREKRRQEMGEPYRTLLGHFRHEVGHYFWDVLVRDRGKLEASRALFGDDTLNYGEALKRHYAEGPPGDWQQRYVSSYATTHPWEDFAETWAHYIHIVDTLEMAAAFGLEVHPQADKTGHLAAEVSFDPYTAERFDTVIAAWLPVTFALNSVNRAMGLRDLYPFILSPPVIEKLGFVHQLVQGRRRRS